MRRIICIGSAAIDCKLKSASTLKTHTSNPVHAYTTFGGVASNVAENLAHWTNAIHLQSVIGDDNEGETILNHLKKLQIDVSKTCRLANKKTAHYYAVLNEKGDLFIALADMAIFDNIPHETLLWDMQHLTSHDIVFLDTSFSTEFMTHLLKLSREKKFLLCIDPISVIKAKKLPASLAGTYLLKPNQQEAESLTGIAIHTIEDCKSACEILLARGVKNIVLSRANQGYVLMNQDHFFVKDYYSPFAISDVNGAGDAFVAGILFGLQQNMNLHEAAKIGEKAAHLTLQSPLTVANITRHQLLGKEKYDANFL